METGAQKHQPVLVKEVIENLTIKPNGIYIDATFGRGGHSAQILKHLGQQGRLIAIDKDPEAAEYARDFFASDKRFSICQGSFAQLKEIIMQQNGIGQINGILLDLGVSSPQLENANRGFSFLKEGPLDMRIDPQQGISAAEWLKTAKEAEIAQVLHDYGEERFAKRIAKAILLERMQQPILTTTQLAEIVAKANPSWEQHKHPATRTFQAIRIYINQELEDLKAVLEQSLEILSIGGRLLVISFHSLEDRLVKQFIQKYSEGERTPFPFMPFKTKPRLKKINKPIKPNPEEIEQNPRARSAILRVAEKIL